MNYEADIPAHLAASAFQGTSFNPEHGAALAHARAVLAQARGEQ